MRYLITGGAGFIGSYLAEALVGAGHQVTAIDDLSTGRMLNVRTLAEDCNFHLVVESITNSTVMGRLVSEIPTVVRHDEWDEGGFDRKPRRTPGPPTPYPRSNPRQEAPFLNDATEPPEWARPDLNWGLTPPKRQV